MAQRAAGWRYWLGSGLLLITLVYSAGLHLAWGPEATVRATYFNRAPSPSVNPEFPDYGARHDQPLAVLGDDAWKLGGFIKDEIAYLRLSGPDRVGEPPYSYRVLPTTLVGALSALTGMPRSRAFMVLNVVSVLLAALLFVAYLRRHYALDDTLALLGGVLVVTMVAVTRTVSYPMLEPASILAIGVVFWTVAGRQVGGFVIAAAAAVATKEVLAVTGLLWLAHHAQRGDRRRLLGDVALALWPALVFVLIRVVVGNPSGEPDSQDVLAGELPWFVRRIATLEGLASLLGRTFLAFGFLWLGLLSARDHPMLARHAVIVPPILLATYLLSFQVTRVLGVVYPVVLPGFLLWLRAAMRRDARRDRAGTPRTRAAASRRTASRSRR